MNGGTWTIFGIEVHSVSEVIDFIKEIEWTRIPSRHLTQDRSLFQCVVVFPLTRFLHIINGIIFASNRHMTRKSPGCWLLFFLLVSLLDESAGGAFIYPVCFFRFIFRLACFIRSFPLFLSTWQFQQLSRPVICPPFFPVILDIFPILAMSWPSNIFLF